MKILVIGDFHGKLPEKLKKKILKSDFDFIVGLGDYTGIDEWRPYISYLFKLKDKQKRLSPKEFFGKKRFKKLMIKDFEAGKNVLKFLDDLGKPGFYVFGNGDEEWYDYPFSKKILQAKKRNLNFLKKLKNLKEMTYKVRKHGEVSFFGFGGFMDASANKSVRSKEWQAKVEVRNKKAKNKMNSLIKRVRGNSIFIFHYPPFGVFDKILDKKNPFYGGRTGVDFFRKVILKKKPLLVLCGHMHEYQGMKKLGRTKIVTTGSAKDGKGVILDIDEKKGKVKKIKFLR